MVRLATAHMNCAAAPPLGPMVVQYVRVLLWKWGACVRLPAVVLLSPLELEALSSGAEQGCTGVVTLQRLVC